MIIDIRDDIPDFFDYVRRRVDGYVAKSKKGYEPAPVSGIDFGFEFGQSNWVVLLFDTRKDPEPDGNWTLFLDKMKKELLSRPKWPIWHTLREDESVYFVDLSGKRVDVTPNPDELCCKIIGEALKHVLVTARDQGVFSSLSMAARCEMGVENLEGYYGWPAYEDRGRENLV